MTPLPFDTVVPIPYKIVAFVELGIVLWYLIVLICHRHHMNVLSLLHLSYSPHSYSRLDGTQPGTGELATIAAATASESAYLLKGIWQTIQRTGFVLLVSYTAFVGLHLIHANDNIVLEPLLTAVPLLTIVLVLWQVFGPPTKLGSFGQKRLYTTVRRIVGGGINSASMRTNDILISDSLTSYARVLNDTVLFVWTSLASAPYSASLEMVVLAVPTVIRIRQCWHEYRRTGLRLHLLNLLKYTTALGPIVINYLIKRALSRLSPEDPNTVSQEDLVHTLSRLNSWWYLTAIINSTYLFIWDVRMDWGFHMLEPLFNAKGLYLSLRPLDQLVYRNWLAYYGVVATDFVLRFLWVLKLTVNEDSTSMFRPLGVFLFAGDVHSLGFAVVELLEILRRWLWCFFKLESDWVKMRVDVPTDIALTDL